MICVSIGRGRHAMMMAEHKHIVEQGAQLVELRLDFIRRPVNLKRLMSAAGSPVVATCRRAEDRGLWRRTEEERVALLRSAIAYGVDYVDLEMDIASKIPRYGNTQRIVSYHNFDETPGDLEEIHHQITKLDPDAIKIVTMANNPIDNMTALRLCRDSEIPTVAFCMGEMGMFSRILCGKFGAPFTYATFSEDRPMAPGQLSFQKMEEVYHYDEINSDTTLLGVIADPVAHSLSPTIHNAAIRENDLNMLYLPFRVPREYLESFISICPELGVKGLSVTIPHKERVIKCINAPDDQVAGIKAANTVVFKDNNTFGYNTDCYAAIKSLEDRLQEKDPESPSVFVDKQVMLLGAGGVARAIAFGLLEKGAKVTIAARDFKKADALATAMDCQSIEWPERADFECDVIINCTPVGMHPNMNDTPFDGQWFDKSVVVFDTVYNPEQTLFIKLAREAGCETVTGIDMFVLQAARQFELFTDTKADMDVLRYEVKRATSAAKYDSYAGSQELQAAEGKDEDLIFLIGYRGSGKTTVGKLLAKKMEMRFYDSDRRIEAATGKTIAEIFADKGEAAFRKMEAKIIAKIIVNYQNTSKAKKEDSAEKSGCVVSLGGGAPMNEASRQMFGGHGKCVLLRGKAETLWQRISADESSKESRPDLTDEGGLGEVQSMLALRSSTYDECADHIVDVDDLSPQEVADQIAQWLQESRKS
jgi:3-dehydroquinate dehydratase/shikimate dehydrogenase